MDEAVDRRQRPGRRPAVSIDNGRCVAAVNALKNLDFARTLAEPTLTALNGQEASSQVGGQFPVPVVTGLTPAGLQGVSFVPFGVQLEVHAVHHRQGPRSACRCRPRSARATPTLGRHHRQHLCARAEYAQFPDHGRAARRPDAGRGRPDPEQLRRGRLARARCSATCPSSAGCSPSTAPRRASRN